MPIPTPVPWIRPGPTVTRGVEDAQSRSPGKVPWIGSARSDAVGAVGVCDVRLVLRV